MLWRPFIAALWSHAEKGLTSWLSFVMFNCVFVTFPCGIQGQIWYLIVSNTVLCPLSYFQKRGILTNVDSEGLCRILSSLEAPNGVLVSN